MPSEQLESLLEQSAMRDAVAVVFERSDGGDRELQWDDVSDALSSGQWGRLIQEDVLVGTTGGFALADPDGVRNYLEEGSRETDDAAESPGAGEGWKWYDKAAGLAALLLFTGYFNTGVRNAVGSVDNVVLGPVTSAVPFYVVVLMLAVVTGLYSSTLQSLLRDTEAIREYQDRLQRLNERKEAAKERGDEEALERIREEQADAMGDQLGMMKLQFRPMVWIMLLTVPVFLWLRWKIRGGHLGTAQSGLVLPVVGSVSWRETVGPMPAWILWYFLCSVAFRQIIQKTLDLGTNR